MDSRKSQRALVPGKSIFKDVALATEYREISQKLAKSATLLCRSDAIITWNLKSASILPSWVKAGYRVYNFIILALLSPHLSIAALWCLKKGYTGSSSEFFVQTNLPVCFLTDVVSLAITSNGKKKNNVLNHKENTCAKNILGKLIGKMVNRYLKNNVNSQSEVTAGNLLSCAGLF